MSKSALEAFLDRPVKSVSIRNNDAVSMSADGKHERYDINCLVDGEDGDQCEVEMQATPMKGDSEENEHRNIKWRSVYYLSHLHSNQPGEGIDYGEFVRSYQVMLCNYKVFARENGLVEKFTYRNPNGDELCDATTSIFIDLTKSKELAKKPVDEMTPAEAWAVFLALANKAEYSNTLKEVIDKMEGISVANDILQNISQTPDERARYRAQLKARLDYQHDMVVNRKEETIGIAKRMLQEGLSVELISRVCLLAIEEVRELQKGNTTVSEDQPPYKHD